MFAGQIIRYRISPLPGIWLNWMTEICRVDAGTRFIDEQRAEPYKLWRHEHRFVPENGDVRMYDHVTYEVGWGPRAELIWVKRQLQQIFDDRRRGVAEIFTN